MPHHRLRAVTRRRTIPKIGLLAFVMTATACSGAATESTATKHTVTIAISGQPTLDPYKANLDPNNLPTAPLAYASLIRMNADRTFSGDLAESFGYTDKQNRIFQLKLRSGVKFADGTPLDANAVVGSLRYMLKVSPKAQTWAGTISGITAQDSSTVVVTNKTPNPVMRQLLSQAVLSGSIIAPAGLSDPSRLARQTFGAGPYVLDPTNTVPTDHYTYTANPHYWNKAAQYWAKVVVRVLPEASATVQALRTRQIDYAALTADAGPAVSAAGLKYVTASVAVIGMLLADRDGTIAPELKDVRVRQALNYAIDRAAIAKAVYGAFARPTSQTAAPGFDGYNRALSNRYPYDPARAKRLLADAGYTNGFTLKVETQSSFGINIITEAVIAQWKEVGVAVELTTDAQVAQWLEGVMSRTFPVTGFAHGNLPTYLSSLDFVLPVANPFNPFATGDDQLGRLFSQAAAEPELPKQTALFQRETARLTELAWFAPVVRVDGIAVMGPRIAGIETAADNGLPSVLTIRPAS